MKLSKGQRIAVKVIAILLYLVAAYGFIQIAYGKPPVMQPSANHTEAYKIGFYFGKYLRFYILPFVFAYAGWLLYKVGREKPESTISEEDESKKISE
jgi:hypothetical protein